MERKYNKQPKLNIKTGDRVKVIAGDERGKTGVVKKVLRKEQRVIVEGLNIVKKHVKPSAQNPQGGIIEVEAPIHISNVMLIDPKTGEPTRVGRRRDENGKLRRYSKKTNEFID
ncbi:MAG: 50S ribosomal protein L24 [Thermonema sp.]|jgi:large subunit ribosomal protein L24|uniref:50S ribosomal protein L24 n=1 Tax=Thermonema sp. TaxID=2231181 RepID=UPI0021DE039C|nr:50S ribosomal protein L24 [Thermonema sp.]GIV40346.1 MAG: 50S ribosomal protein L24 [Thermonema sp.]